MLGWLFPWLLPEAEENTPHLFVVVVVVLFFFFLGLLPWHMEVPRLGVESELHLLAYTIVTEMPGPSGVCNLHCSSQQRHILNPLSEARDRTHVLMDTS